MAMTATISAGADAAYPFRSMGGSEQSVTGQKGGTEYYLSASREGGEPHGKWVGEGLADLGIHDGRAITKDDEDLFRQIYSEFLDVRDPSGGTPLGKAPRESSQAERIYQEKLAAEPGATAERKQELRYQARAEAPAGTVRFRDNTLSVDKTITLAHASALAAAKEAREAGDNDAARMWEARAAGVWEEIGKAVKVYIDYQQQEAGYVRPGHHGARVGDAEAGRFERAHDIPVAAFAQHTSRNGDPHLHVHTLWLNRVKTVSDGQWRAVDSRALHRNKQEAAAKAAFSLESALTRRFGFEWAYREESKGRVLTAVPQKTATEFSSRRAEVSAETGRLREKYWDEYGLALTSDRRVEAIVGPAGSGKSTVARQLEFRSISIKQQPPS
jgi:TrwC relaxase